MGAMPLNNPRGSITGLNYSKTFRWSGFVVDAP